MRKIYFDHAATTPVDSNVVAIMNEYMTKNYGNPSSVHSFGREARKGIDLARNHLANLIGAEKASEIIFTSGGTESDNLAIKGALAGCKKNGKHIITTDIEHHAILHTFKFLEKNGYRVTYLPVASDGILKIADLEQAITQDTVLISVMFANNEVGTLQPIKEIGQITREKGIIFHTDAVQAVGNVPINVQELNIDLLSLSGHKFYGPKGIGALYVKSGIKILPVQHGGAHERNLRAGTENVPGIVGIGKAAEIAINAIPDRMKHISALRNKIIDNIMANIPDVILNGNRDKRLPNNVNFSFRYIEGESLLLSLDMQGIAATSGSACTSGTLDPSHVLLAMGLDHETAHGSLRITLGEQNTVEEVDYFLEVLPKIVHRLREMSPLYNK